MVSFLSRGSSFRPLLFAGLFVALVGVRLPSASQLPPHGPVMEDALSLTLGGVDRLLGAPLTNTHWPGLPNQLVLQPLIAVDFLLVTNGNPTPDRFVDYLAATYRNPGHVLWLARIAAIAIVSLGFTALAWAVWRRTGLWWEPAAFVWALATSPLVWAHTVEASSEAFAFGFGTLAAAVLLLPDSAFASQARRVALAAAATALMLASRNTFLPYAVFLTALLLQMHPEKRLRSLLLFVAVLAAVGLAACPAVWLEPVRFVKANFGNYRKTGLPVGYGPAALIAAEAAPAWLWLAGTGALVGVFLSRWYFIAIGSVGALGFLLTAAARSPFVQPRYFLSAVLISGSLLAIAACSFGAASRPGARVFHRLIPVLAAILALAGTAHVIASSYRPQDQSAQEASAVRAHLTTRTGWDVAIPYGYFHVTADLASNESLRELRLRLESALTDGAEVAAHLAAFGLSARVADALPLDFNEKDMALAARLRVMSASVHPGTVHIHYIGDPSYARRLGLLTEADARTLLEQGLIDELITIADAAPAQADRITQNVWALRPEPR